MTSGWDAVWAARQTLDGGLPGVTEPAWYDFVDHVAEALDVGPGTGVFEVGCGPGAFLFPFFENGYRMGGIDRSPGFVRVAARAMPGGDFSVGEPGEVDPGEPWEVVVASSLFGQLADLDAARGVLARMMAKATHAVAVVDVPEAEEGDSAGAEGGVLRVDRNWMLHALVEIGASAVQVEDAIIEGDRRLGSRFNVFVRV